MYQRILVGTDGSPTAELAVRHACRLATVTGGTVHVATAWQPVPAMVVAGALGVAPVGTDDGAWVERLHRGIVREAEGMGVAVRTHTLTGPAASSLLDLADEIDADLLVVGNAGMQGLRGKLGSVPNTIAHKAHCAVLVVPTS
jgi:nucleotide-binding universal stress UspA family protein